MMGTRDDPGVIFRSVDHLLESSNADLNTEYTFTVELLEVYLDKLVDLLSGNPISEQVCTIKGGTVANLERRKVTTTEEVIAVMEEGRANRKVASTVMNSESSRSHFLVFITVDGLNKVTGKTSSAKLTLVDLAGSERLAKAHAKNSKRLAETVSINKSLASLGHVFSCIHSGAKHVPFRNSKLTHVLQEVICTWLGCRCLTAASQSWRCRYGRIIAAMCNERLLCTRHPGYKPPSVPHHQARPNDLPAVCFPKFGWILSRAALPNKRMTVLRMIYECLLASVGKISFPTEHMMFFFKPC